MSSQQAEPPGLRVRLGERLRHISPLWFLGAGLLALRLMLLPVANLAARASALYPLSQSSHPYFQPAHALLLYLAIPLVALGTFIFLLSPGALLLLYLPSARRGKLRLEEFILKAFGLSMAVLVSLHLMLVKPGLLQFSQPAEFAWLITLLDALLWLGLWLRSRAGALNLPRVDAAARRRLVIMAGIILIGVILLLPKLFWENFNGDGFEIFDLARSLHQEALPSYHTWWIEPYRVDLRMLLPAYPVFWTMSVLGPVEAAARLPYLFYLALIYLLVLSFSEVGVADGNNSPPTAYPKPIKPEVRFGPATELILALQLAVIAVTLGYNASYNPWFADLASPAALDTLFVLLAVASMFALWRGELAWLALFGLLAGFTRPTLVYLLLPFALALVLLRHPQRWKLLAATVGVLLLGQAASMLLKALPGSNPASEMYALSELLDKYRYLKLDEFQRLAYLVVPGGILPALSLLTWRWQDRLARAISLTTGFYFLAFYILAFQALHYYAPVMLLPLVVFWRIVLHYSMPVNQKQRSILRYTIGGAALLAGLALLLSLPRSFQLSNAERRMGLSLDCAVCDYDNQRLPESVDHRLLEPFHPAVFDVPDPHTRWGIEFANVLYYSEPDRLDADAFTGENSQSTTVAPQYFALPLELLAPAGATRVGEYQGIQLYVSDEAAWHADQTPSLPADYRSRLYDIPMEILFPFRGLAAGVPVFDLFAWWR